MAMSSLSGIKRYKCYNRKCKDYRREKKNRCKYSEPVIDCMYYVDKNGRPAE